MMATSLRNWAPPGGNLNPNAKRDMINMIYAIGPDAAQQGLMQSGRLLSGSGGSPKMSPAEKMAGQRPNPYSFVGTPEGKPTQPFVRGGGPSLNYEKGTLPGTVPRTGQTEVHKGEVVIPKEQVDSPLMSYLVADAARKRVPLGEKSRGGYQDGSLGLSDDEFLDQWQKDLSDPDIAFLRKWMKDIKKPKAPEPKKVPPKYELPEDRSFLLQPDTREDRGLSYAERVGRGARVVGEAVREGVGGLAQAGHGFWTGVAGSPEAYQEEYLKDVPALVAAGEEAKAPPLGPPSEYLQQAPIEPPPSDTGFAGAQGRVRSGDFGTREDPLTLTGQLSPREEAYREISGTPEQRDAKHKAGMAQAKVSNLLTTLGTHGHAMDPEVKKSMMEQVAFHSKVAKGWQGEIREREKAVEEELKASEASAAAMEKAYELEKQKIEGRIDRDKTRAEQRAEILDQRFLGNNLRDTYNTIQNAKTNAERQRGLDSLATYISEAVRRQGGPEMSPEGAIDAAINFSGLPPDKMEEAIAALAQG